MSGFLEVRGRTIGRRRSGGIQVTGYLLDAGDARTMHQQTHPDDCWCEDKTGKDFLAELTRRELRPRGYQLTRYEKNGRAAVFVWSDMGDRDATGLHTAVRGGHPPPPEAAAPTTSGAPEGLADIWEELPHHRRRQLREYAEFLRWLDSPDEA